MSALSNTGANSAIDVCLERQQAPLAPQMTKRHEPRSFALSRNPRCCSATLSFLLRCESDLFRRVAGWTALLLAVLSLLVVPQSTPILDGAMTDAAIPFASDHPCPLDGVRVLDLGQYNEEILASLPMEENQNCSQDLWIVTCSPATVVSCPSGE